MSPPRICPPPPQSPDCPLYAQRLDYGADEPLRRAVLMERYKARPGLGELVWADFNRQHQRAEAVRPNPPGTPPPTRPTLPPTPQPLPILDHLKQKGATNG
jgi:hypothetical protein